MDYHHLSPHYFSNINYFLFLLHWLALPEQLQYLQVFFLEFLLLFLLLLLLYVCVCVHIQIHICHSIHVGARGQLAVLPLLVPGVELRMSGWCSQGFYWPTNLFADSFSLFQSEFLKSYMCCSFLIRGCVIASSL